MTAIRASVFGKVLWYESMLRAHEMIRRVGRRRRCVRVEMCPYVCKTVF